MNIIAFDTSAKACTVSLLANDKTYFESRLNGNTHSVNLMPMINNQLSNAGILPNQLDYIACVVGPGSFTGVRIGVSVAKGMAHGISYKCIPLNALEALAENCKTENTLICPAYDARSNQLYCAAYIRENNRLKNIITMNAMSVDEYIDKINELDIEYDISFIGDGAINYRKFFAKKIIRKNNLIDISYPTGDDILSLALSKVNDCVSYNDLMPLYLREPQAVRLRNSKND